MSIEVSGSKVLITSGGFLGTHLFNALKQAGAEVVSLCHKATELCNWWSTYQAFYKLEEQGFRPDYVFHLAGYNGGIAFNAKYPADIFFRNTMMALNVLELCRIAKVKKVVSVVASCAYPADELKFYDTIYPTGEDSYLLKTRERCPEHEFFEGPPHESVACHGYAKRNLQLASLYAKQQYGLNAVCACPTTLYGPGDSFDKERTKVMGGLISKFADAVARNEQEVVCWGSGEPKREFLYVEDAARLLIETMKHYDDSSLPLNLGTGQEKSIREVASLVAEAVLFKGHIRWDTSRPDGQYRKRLDLTRMNLMLPPWAPTPLEDGIAKTVAWYRSTFKK